MYTNININHQNYSFNYIVEYQKTNILNEKKFSYNSNSLEVDDMYLNDKKLFYNKTTNQYIYHN